MQACKNILIVEDDDAIRESLQIALELEGYRVTTAANGKEGLQALPGMASPCLILLDLMMPVMDGWAFAEALRENDKLASIPVIVVSAFADQAEPVRQARGVLKKPVALEQLLQTVRQYCSWDHAR